MSLSMGLSKHCQNGSAFLLGNLMKSMQQWTINGEVISKRAEYEDLKKIAEKSGIPLKKVRELVK